MNVMPEVPIAAAIERLVKRYAGSLKVSAAAVTAFAAGRTTIRRPGSTATEAGLPRLIPSVPKPGDRVAVTAIGGAATVLGVISRAAVSLLDLGAPLVGQVYTLSFSSSSATAATNTSNSTYASVRSVTWSSAELPDGVYDLTVQWDAQFADSASGSLNFRPTINGTVDTVQTLSIGTARERIGYTRLKTAEVVSGGLTVLIEYKRDSGSGTASARNPRISVVATRREG